MLPQVAVIPSTPVSYDYNKRSITVLNVLNHGLWLGPRRAGGRHRRLLGVRRQDADPLQRRAGPGSGRRPAPRLLHERSGSVGVRRRADDAGGLRAEHPDDHADRGEHAADAERRRSSSPPCTARCRASSRRRRTSHRARDRSTRRATATDRPPTSRSRTRRSSRGSAGRSAALTLDERRRRLHGRRRPSPSRAAAGTGAHGDGGHRRRRPSVASSRSLNTGRFGYTTAPAVSFSGGGGTGARRPRRRSATRACAIARHQVGAAATRRCRRCTFSAPPVGGTTAHGTAVVIEPQGHQRSRHQPRLRATLTAPDISFTGGGGTGARGDGHAGLARDRPHADGGRQRLHLGPTVTVAAPPRPTAVRRRSARPPRPCDAGATVVAIDHAHQRRAPATRRPRRSPSIRRRPPGRRQRQPPAPRRCRCCPRPSRSSSRSTTAG